MLNIGVCFDIEPFNSNTTNVTDGSQVIAHEVHEHPVLCSFLLIVEHFISEQYFFLLI